MKATVLHEYGDSTMLRYEDILKNAGAWET